MVRASGSICMEEQNLQWVKLNFQLPPWIIPYRTDDDKVRLHGIFGSMFGNLTQSLNLTYEAFVPSDGQYGSYSPDGIFNGQLQMVGSNLIPRMISLVTNVRSRSS